MTPTLLYPKCAGRMSFLNCSTLVMINEVPNSVHAITCAEWGLSSILPWNLRHIEQSLSARQGAAYLWSSTPGHLVSISSSSSELPPSNHSSLLVNPGSLDARTARLYFGGARVLVTPRSRCNLSASSSSEELLSDCGGSM